MMIFYDDILTFYDDNAYTITFKNDINGKRQFLCNRLLLNFETTLLFVYC